MGNYPDADRRFDIRRMIDLEEERLEVSELEKILSHLAYFAALAFSDPNGGHELRLEFKTMVGHCARRTDLGEKSQKWLVDVCRRLGLQKRPRVAFYMWTAWLAQKDHDRTSEVRNAFEWDQLPDEMVVERQRLLELMERLSADLLEITSHLPDTAEDAKYALGNLLGSPLAVLRTARSLLSDACDQLTKLEKRAWEAYGFGDNHRPNRRFDRNARRNIEAYYRWLNGTLDDDFVRTFLPKNNDDPGMRTARNSAIKEATRIRDRFDDYELKLERFEHGDEIPLLAYSRVI